MSWFTDHASELDAAGISQEQARDWAAQNINPDGSQDTHRLIEALGNSTNHRSYDSQSTDPTEIAANAADDAAAAPAAAPAATVGGSGVGSVSNFNPASFGAAPAAYGETYTALGRPSWLQGQYVPGQWNETFQAPAKSATLQAEYALPTQADLEASPGYLAGQTAMQRGMERSAAAKGSILSGGFVGRTLPRAMGEYAGGAYNNLVGQTLGARQQQYGEYSGDVSNKFAQYQQRYGQFADAEGQKLGARNANEAAFQGDEAANRNQFATRYSQFMDAAGMKRQAENDVWGRNVDMADIGLRTAALARP